MRKALSFAAVIGVAIATCGCAGGRKGSSGFHLPDGDVTRGKAAFASLQCHACHQVSGVDLPAPVADPPVPVVLGGRIPQARTDGELVTSIVDPSHRIAPGYRADAVTSGKLSRMGEFREAMSVQELVDVVAFLQSSYEVVPPDMPIK
jgi:hypothetical protein